MMAALAHDSPGEIAQPMGEIKDWRKGEIGAIPGKTMPNFQIVTRDYPNVYEQMTTIGPELKKGYVSKGIKIAGEADHEELISRIGVSKREGVGKGNPDI